MNTINLEAKEVDYLPLYQVERLEHQADTMYSKGQWLQASEILKLAVQKRRQLDCNTDPATAFTLHKLALTLLHLHHPEQAERVLFEAEKILESKYYPGHGSLAPLLEHHADCLIEEGNFSQAEVLLKRSHEIYAKTLTMENRDTLRSMYKLALLCLQEKKPAEAEEVLQKAMKHVDTPLGPCAEFRFQLALAYAAEGKTDEAMKLLDSSIAEFRQRHDYRRAAECLEIYVKLQANPDKTLWTQSLKEGSQKYRYFDRICPYAEDIFLATLLRA